MKLKNLLFIVGMYVLTQSLHSQENYMVDDYSTPSLWTQVGSNVEVSGGVVNFKNLSRGSQQRRIYRAFPDSLTFQDDWKIAFDFIYTSLGSNNGNPVVGHTLISLTEDSEETGRLCPDINCTGYPRSETDYIAVYYGSDLFSGGSRFSINTKIDGHSVNSSYLFFYNTNQKLFFDFSKKKDLLSLKVYEDEGRTILLNSQELLLEVCEFNGLKFIQHGVSAAADSRRGLTGEIDNLIIDKNFANGCTTLPYWFANSTSIFSKPDINIGIGTSAARSRLSVLGNIGVEGDVIAKGIVARPQVWPDYVFTPDYQLTSLDELETFINNNGHLPNVPTEEQVSEKGLRLEENNALLLEKIEELTLHIIELNKRLKALEKAQ